VFKLKRKVEAIVTVLIGVSVLGIWLCSQGGAAFCSTVIERVNGETAQAEVAAYVRAIARGDERGAFAVWELPGWEAYDGWRTALSKRRQGLDDQVVKLAVGPIISRAEHLHIVQSAGKDVRILVDAAILDHRVLASTDCQVDAGHHPGQRGRVHQRAGGKVDSGVDLLYHRGGLLLCDAAELAVTRRYAILQTHTLAD